MREGGAAGKLTLIRHGLDPASPRTVRVTSAWARIVSGLKTLLETGEPLMIGT